MLCICLTAVVKATGLKKKEIFERDQSLIGRP